MTQKSYLKGLRWFFSRPPTICAVKLYTFHWQQNVVLHTQLIMMWKEFSWWSNVQVEADMCHVKFHLSCKVLQTPNVDGPFFWSIEVAATHAQVWCGTNHATSETQGVVWEYSLGCAIVVLKSAPKQCTPNWNSNANKDPGGCLRI